MSFFGWIAKTVGEEVVGKHGGKCARCGVEAHQGGFDAPPLHRRGCCNVRLCHPCRLNLGDQYGGSPNESRPCCGRKTGGGVAPFWATTRGSGS